MKPTIAIYDAAEDIAEVREMTDSEYADYLDLQKKLAEEELERETKQEEALAAKAAVLAKLGLTVEEASLLIS